MTGTQIGGGGNTKPQQHSGTILETSLSTKFTKHTIFNKSFFITNAFGKIEKFSGFTLAEVLITLGIIGIVAAMTIPNIVGNYKKKVIETRLQRFYSVANNALLASQAENESWDFGILKLTLQYKIPKSGITYTWQNIGKPSRQKQSKTDL